MTGFGQEAIKHKLVFLIYGYFVKFGNPILLRKRMTGNVGVLVPRFFRVFGAAFFR